MESQVEKNEQLIVTVSFLVHITDIIIMKLAMMLAHIWKSYLKILNVGLSESKIFGLNYIMIFVTCLHYMTLMTKIAGMGLDLECKLFSNK